MNPTPPFEPDPHAAGPTIGRYELVSRIGVGGMGEVFLARSVGAGGFAKEVVIKRILPHLASDPGFVQRFIEEGKLVVRLRHAGIAQVLDMGEEAGVFFIAMEHVDGKDLGELMRIAATAGMRMPVPLVAHLLACLLDALDYAHRAKDTEQRPLGIIHRDVSPSNVMIAATGEVKLLDFGIARAAERLQHSTTGAIRGKYSYMSPQQAAGLDLDARSDLFSVGVIAWELFTGERPFDGSSDLLTLDRIRFHDPGKLRDKLPDVPEDLAAIVERLLAKTPEARFVSADEAAQALRAHMVRSGKLATTRELAAWMESVLATLPRSLRARSVQGMSVDDLLRMGLGSDPGTASPSTPAGDATAREPRPRTVLVSSSPALALAPVSTLTPAPAPTPTPTPALAPAPITQTGASSSRALFLTLLVTLNLALIALVLFLVFRPGADKLVKPSEAIAATAPRPDATALPDVDRGEPETIPAKAPEAEVAPMITATPGSAAGGALATLGESLFAEDVALVIRVSAPGAMVAITGHGTARAPRTITARAGTMISGRVTAPDHEPRAFEAVVGEDPSVQVTLKAVPQGSVQFKFFPAEGTSVMIDDKPVRAGGNVVSAPLPVGPHTLVLEHFGKRLVRKFTVEEGKATSLGTLDANRGE